MRKRAWRLLGACLAVAALGATGVYAASEIAGVGTAGGTIHACYQKLNGQLRIVASADACRPSELPISWNEQGPPGDPGAAGPQGAGASVAALTVGDASCPTGGVAVSGENGTAYACNGAKGDKGDKGAKGDTGDAGPTGPAGPAFLGSTCTLPSGTTGTVTSVVGSGGAIALSCATGGGTTTGDTTTGDTTTGGTTTGGSLTDPWEPNDTAASATFVGGPLTAAISPASDVDWYRIPLVCTGGALDTIPVTYEWDCVASLDLGGAGVHFVGAGATNVEWLSATHVDFLATSTAPLPHLYGGISVAGDGTSEMSYTLVPS